MSTQSIIPIVVAILAIAVILMALANNRKRRTEGLKEQFGPEYEHLIRETGDRRAAEEELAARQNRVEALHIHALEPGQRDRFAAQWKQVQAEFVDAPDRAVADADHLVQQVMESRGYPLGDFEQRAADISVDHADVVTHYRAAHDIALRQDSNSATTEDLRQAMVHYRALFEDLLHADDGEQVSQEAAKAEADTSGRQYR